MNLGIRNGKEKQLCARDPGSLFSFSLQLSPHGTIHVSHRVHRKPPRFLFLSTCGPWLGYTVTAVKKTAERLTGVGRVSARGRARMGNLWWSRRGTGRRLWCPELVWP
jgi:hypothetical protein